MAERQYVDVRGLRFAYRESGQRQPVPVLFLHGLGDNADTWAQTMAALPARWTIALDQRGHGQTAWPTGYELPDMAEDVAGVLDRLGIDQVDLVAHSMGAMVAYLFASRYPDRVRRLVLEEPAPPEPASPPRDEGQRPDGELSYDWAIQAPFSAQRNNPDPAWSRDLAKISASTLIMTGADSHIPTGGAGRMAMLIPDCRLVSYPTGHELHAVMPEQFSNDVVDFLAGS